MSEKNISVSIKIVNPKAVIPSRATQGSAGYDLFLPEDVTLYPFTPTKINLGFCMSLPKNTHASLYIRSSYALKGLSKANSVGIVDSDYRDEIAAIIVNCTQQIVNLKAGERVVQMIVTEHCNVAFKKSESLDSTSRAGGFGSTGA